MTFATVEHARGCDSLFSLGVQAFPAIFADANDGQPAVWVCFDLG